ncbi:MAG: hypothetical protein HUU20_08290 [Pirellulales bacterium]|nr:hypothetical protein [Pirellulales bacterium]
MKALLFPITCFLLGAAISPAAEVIEAGLFSVDAGPALSVRCNGKTVIAGDRCLSLRGLPVSRSPPLLDTTQGEIIRSGNAFTLLASRGRNRFRREVSVTGQGVEITFEIRALGPTGGTHLLYDLITPPGLLDGAACEATVGEPRDDKQTRPAVFDIAAVKPQDYHLRSLVYLGLPQIPCAIDFNPQGSWLGEGNVGEAKSVNSLHDGKQWHFVSFCSGATDGAIFSGKIIVRPGTPPFEDFHQRTGVVYSKDFPIPLALNFSERDGDARYRACPVPAPDSVPCRWLPAGNVRIVTRDKGGLLYRDFASPAKPEGETTLELKQRSGLYLLTLNVCDPAEPTGPFTISGSEGVIIENITLRPGEHWVKSVPLRFREGKALLRFHGDWKLNALTLQTILHEPEDFLFDRPFWTMGDNQRDRQ